MIIKCMPAVFTLAIILSCSVVKLSDSQNIPSFLLGQFEDDYGNSYNITKELLVMSKDNRFHIIESNTNSGYLILQNDSLNSFAPGLFSRLDYVQLKKMNPYKWAFCFTAYNAESLTLAKSNQNSDINELQNGCNGYPFSRMKRKRK